MESATSFHLFKRVILRPPRGPDASVAIAGVRVLKSAVLLKFEGVEARERAEILAGSELLVPRVELPETPEGEYYWADLIGLEAFDQSGGLIGRVKNLFSAGADDILVIDSEGREVLVPFREETVAEVDLELGRLTLRPPEGLLEIYLE
jgi:16S rRNA processing protein RimM